MISSRHKHSMQVAQATYLCPAATCRHEFSVLVPYERSAAFTPLQHRTISEPLRIHEPREGADVEAASRPRSFGKVLNGYTRRADRDVDLPHQTVPVFRDAGGLVARATRQVACATRAFTLIEIIAVVAVIAILVAVIAPSVIRRVDRAAWTRETADLKSIADGYTQSIVRNKIVPGTNTWATAIASQMSLAPSSITTNSRRYARAFLVDTNLSIGGAGLPYTQTSNGVAKPTSARVMIVSSLGRALPISTGVPNITEFNAIWNTAEGAKPATATWTSWAGTGEDLRIKKLNLEPLFYQLILVNHSGSTNVVPRYSIDNSGSAIVPAGAIGLDKYFLESTVVGLLDKNSQVQNRHLLKRNISFMFESDAWRGQIQGDQQSYSASGSDFFNHAVTFFSRPTNPWGDQAHGSSQWGVMIAMYTFMFDYTFWANECPHFDRHGNSLNSVPEYILLDNQGANGGNVNTFSGNLIVVH